MYQRRIGRNKLAMVEVDKIVALCSEENKLLPSFDRHIHAVGNFVVKIRLSDDEKSYNGRPHYKVDLRDANNVHAMELVKKYTEVPVPNVVYSDSQVSILEKIEGDTLYDVWEQLDSRNQSNIKFQLANFIKQWRNIPNDPPFKIRSLCESEELLHPFFREHPGPFPDLESFHSHYPQQKRDTLVVSNTQPTVFDHMDLHPSNIILHPSHSFIAGIIDWEYAGFYPPYMPSFIHSSCIHPEYWYDIYKDDLYDEEVLHHNEAAAEP